MCCVNYCKYVDNLNVGEPLYWLQGGGKQRLIVHVSVSVLSWWLKLKKNLLQHQYEAQYQKVKQSTVGIRLILEPIHACCSQLEISQRLRESVRLKGLLNDRGGKLGSAEHLQWHGLCHLVWSMLLNARPPNKTWKTLLISISTTNPPFCLHRIILSFFYWAGKDRGGLMKFGFEGMSLTLFQGELNSNFTIFSIIIVIYLGGVVW